MRGRCLCVGVRVLIAHYFTYCLYLLNCLSKQVPACCSYIFPIIVLFILICDPSIFIKHNLFSFPPPPHPQPPPSPVCWLNDLRALSANSTLSETGNVHGSDQHKLLPQYGRFQPGVHGAAGAAEPGLCQLQQLQPSPPPYLQLILPSCTNVRPVQQPAPPLR